MGRLFSSGTERLTPHFFRARPDLQEAFHALDSEARQIASELEDLLDVERPEADVSLRRAVEGVPRIRPILILAAIRASGGEAEGTEDLANIAELLHWALTIHDAALGKQGGRRRRIARRLLGGAVHWLGGNHVTLRALELARSLPSPDILGELLDALGQISRAQALASSLPEGPVDLDDYRSLAESRSGAIFSFCTRAGARLAGAPPSSVSALGRYGRHLGVAWQALEDYWSCSAEPEELLRVLARGEEQGRPLLPLAHALAREERIESLLEAALETGELPIAEALREAIRETGGLWATRKVIVEDTLAARRALRKLPPSLHKDLLEQFAQGLNRLAIPPEEHSGGRSKRRSSQPD